MGVTIRDIARELGVSHSTVSRVLNNSKNFFCSEETRNKVLKTAQEMGYTPNHAARSLVTGRTNLIAVWSPGLHTPSFSQLIYPLHKLIGKSGFEIITGDFGPQVEKPFNGAVLVSCTVDGTIVVGGNIWLDNYIKEHNFTGPLVSICTADSGSTDLVYIDLYPAACEALRSLVDSGRTRIAHMSTPFTRFEWDGRYRAYTNILNELGMKEEYIDIPDGKRITARQMVKEYIQSHGCPDAIFCANDDIAIGAYKGLRETGIRIPDDVALIGCDGLDETDYLDTGITTIAKPSDEVCEIAWQFLQNRIEDPTLPRQFAGLKAHLIVRESTGW